MGTPAGFAPTKECFKRSPWFGKRHKTDAFTKLGNILSELHVPHRQCLTGISDAFSGHLTRGFTVPPTKRAESALHLRALTERSPLNFRRSSIAATWFRRNNVTKSTLKWPTRYDTIRRSENLNRDPSSGCKHQVPYLV